MMQTTSNFNDSSISSEELTRQVNDVVEYLKDIAPPTRYVYSKLVTEEIYFIPAEYSMQLDANYLFSLSRYEGTDIMIFPYPEDIGL